MSKFIPNSFQVPNVFIDEILDKISGNACKIYLLIVRKTRGWNKEADRLSYSQIQKLTGIGSYTTIDKAICELIDLGLIFCKKGNEKSANEYRLNDDFSNTAITETVKGGITENVKAITETVKGGITETVNTEIQYKNTNKKYKSECTHARTAKTEKQEPNEIEQILNLWQPTIQEVNSALQISGLKPMSESDFLKTKFEFLSHYRPRLETGQMRTSQLFGKFVSWCKREQVGSISNTATEDKPIFRENTVENKPKSIPVNFF